MQLVFSQSHVQDPWTCFCLRQIWFKTFPGPSAEKKRMSLEKNICICNYSLCHSLNVISTLPLILLCFSHSFLPYDLLSSIFTPSFSLSCSFPCYFPSFSHVFFFLFLCNFFPHFLLICSSFHLSASSLPSF